VCLSDLFDFVDLTKLPGSLLGAVFEFPPFVRASALSYGRKISERLRVKRESLTGVEVHIGFACASSVRGVVV
jgi:hypothetical protein